MEATLRGEARKRYVWAQHKPSDAGLISLCSKSRHLEGAQATHTVPQTYMLSFTFLDHSEPPLTPFNVKVVSPM